MLSGDLDTVGYPAQRACPSPSRSCSRSRCSLPSASARAVARRSRRGSGRLGLGRPLLHADRLRGVAVVAGRAGRQLRRGRARHHPPRATPPGVGPTPGPRARRPRDRALRAPRRRRTRRLAGRARTRRRRRRGPRRRAQGRRIRGRAAAPRARAVDVAAVARRWPSRAPPRAPHRAAPSTWCTPSRARGTRICSAPAAAATPTTWSASTDPAFGLAWRRLSPRHRVLLAIERSVFADASQTIQCNSRMVQLELIAPLRDPRRAARAALQRRRPRSASTRRAARRRRARCAPNSAPATRRSGSSSARGFRPQGTRHRAARARRRRAATPCSGWPAATTRAPWRERARALGVAARVRWLGARATSRRSAPPPTR